MTKLIFDPIHGFVELSELCLKIVDTPVFQRLRKLKQLGVVHYVFPSATHTRFEHSIGVAHLARKMITSLRNRQTELQITDDHIMCVEIAGLCHDLGHGPWSHLFDDFLTSLKYESKLVEHENRSCFLFQEIVKNEKLPLSPIHVKWICQMIQPPIQSERVLDDFYYQIVANKENGIDVDKFDYLLRDTYFLGFPRRFEYQRIFQYSRVINKQICFSEKSCFEIYDLFLTRYRMHVQVYRHPVVQGLEELHLDILKNITGQDWLGIINYSYHFTTLAHDEIFSMLQSSWPGENPNHNLLHRLTRRQGYLFLGEVVLKSQTTTQKIRQMLCTKFNTQLLSYLIIKINQMGYSEDPVGKVLFYDSHDHNKSYYIDKHKTSYLLPTIFSEYRVRFWCRSREESIVKDCQLAFQFAKQEILI